MSGYIDDGLVSDRFLNSGSSNRRNGRPAPLPRSPALATSRWHACSQAADSAAGRFPQRSAGPARGSDRNKRVGPPNYPADRTIEVCSNRSDVSVASLLRLMGRLGLCLP